MQKEEKISFVKWFSELDRNSGNIAGGKGANLSEIFNLGIPVPPGFVVTAEAYDYFIAKSEIAAEIKELLKKISYENTRELENITKKIREIITEAKFPGEMEEEILEAYEILGAGDSKNIREIIEKNQAIFVAVRSSATTEDLASASFAGQQETFLNIRGSNDLLESIKKCFASLFTARATYYRQKKGFKHEESSLAVIVQKMINSDKSGVIFSKDPSQKSEDVIIEAVFGLGEGIVSGRITPDRYTVSKNKRIAEQISDKKIAIIKDAEGNNKIIQLKEKGKNPVLKEHEASRLADFALKLERHFNKPQDIEFAIEDDVIYIVQTRPITTLEKKLEKTEEIDETPILSGIAASPGIGVGRVKIIEDLKELEKISQGDVLVTKMTNPDMVVTMQKCSAIVTDEGGLTAHAAIVSREMGIPAVVGTQHATLKLKEGEIITVDGSAGKIYKGRVAETKHKKILPVTSETRTKIKITVDLPSFAERASKTGIEESGLVRLEGIIAESGKHPDYFAKQNKIGDYEKIIFNGLTEISRYFKGIWVRTSDIRSDEFQNLEGSPGKKEQNPMLGMHGIRYGIKNPTILKAELHALKKISGVKYIGVMLPQVISVSDVVFVKKLLKEIGFFPKLGVMIETPASVQIIKMLCEEGIDFISFGTNDLTQYTLAIDRGNEQVQEIYDEMHPAILSQLEFVIRTCKKNKVETSICGQAAGRKEMVKFLVEKGIDSISVNADMAAEIADYVEKLEGESQNNNENNPAKSLNIF